MEFFLAGPQRFGNVSGILKEFSCWFWAAGCLAKNSPIAQARFLCSRWAPPPSSPVLSGHQKVVSTNIFSGLQPQLVSCSLQRDLRGTDSLSFPQSGCRGSCSYSVWPGIALAFFPPAASSLSCILPRPRVLPGTGLVIKCSPSLEH